MEEKTTKLKPVRRLFEQFKQYRRQLAIIILLGTLVSVIQPLCVKLVENIVNELQGGVSREFFIRVPLTLVGLFMLSGLAKYFYNTIRRFVSERVILKLREDLFRKYVRMNMYELQRKKVGELLSRMQNDLVQINVGLDTFCDLLKEPIAFVGLLGVAVYCDWKLALATLLVAPLAAHLFSKSGRAVKKHSAKNLQHFSDIVSISQETVVGANVVKIFGMESTLLTRFRGYQNSYFSALWSSIRIQEIATPAVEFIGALLMAGVLFYGGYQISSGAMTSGQLIAFVIAIGLAQMPLKKLNNAFLKMRMAEAAAERIFETLDESEDQENVGQGKPLSAFANSIEFRNVSLSYGTKEALREVSFQVERGQCVAFVGGSGGGKTSIVNLIPRLYEASSGQILIDGVDIREISLASLRAQISIVTQEVFLFNASIADNIGFGKPGASAAEIKRAAELAMCTDFIERHPDGFARLVGDRGSTLSGGERQRIAIARAFLKSSPILILDEATSNLDSRSEAAVQSALNTLMAGRTTLFVAHRLATVRRVDRIFVVESGRIQEQGDHGQLMARQGAYREYVETQLV